MTQQNASLVEQAAAAAVAAAESMKDRAGNLVQVVSVFKLDGARQAAAAANTQHASRLRIGRPAKAVPIAPSSKESASSKRSRNVELEE